MLKEDTIAAIATAPGEGGIGIIRISGPEAFSILEKVFIPIKKNTINKAEKIKKLNIEPRKMIYGNIIDFENNKNIDEVLVVYMKAPHTYTAEDVVEIQCHGSIVALKNILSLVLRMGARSAEEGEFTKRAFLNGRLDLSQAEAVIDLIKAKTDESYDIAINQLSGDISQKIKYIRERILTLLGDITVNIEYPDEDIEEIVYDNLIKSLKSIEEYIEKLLSTSNTGKIIKDGLKVSIAGKPNVGKSSLMNKLLNESRAIVTDIPGTTRDTIEETINIKGIPIRLTDTAGIRETDDMIEKIGIEKSKIALTTADLVIFMVDGSKELSEEDYEIIAKLKNKKSIVLINKQDLGIIVKEDDIKKLIPEAYIVNVSMAEGTGIDKIENIIKEMVYGGEVKHSESVIISNTRHINLLEKSKISINESIRAAEFGEPLDIVEIDINDAYEYLGEIIGESVNDDIIKNVFSRFCLGK